MKRFIYFIILIGLLWIGYLYVSRQGLVSGFIGGEPEGIESSDGKETADAAGKAKGITGVTVPNDRTLKITMTKEYEPHFFYLGLFNIKPYPIGEIAPNCKVKSGAQGIYIDGNFTAETLEKNLLDPESGYAQA